MNLMKLSILLILLLNLNLYGQDFSLALSTNFSPDVREEILHIKDKYNVISYGLDFRLKPLNSYEIFTGLIFQYCSDNLLNYLPEPNPESHPNSTSIGARRDIEMIIIEIPLFYKIFSYSNITSFGGIKLGLVNLEVVDKLNFHDGTDASYIEGISETLEDWEFTFSPLVEVQYALPYSMALHVSIEYKMLDYSIKYSAGIADDPNSNIDPNPGQINASEPTIYYNLNFSGFSYSIGLEYNF